MLQQVELYIQAAERELASASGFLNSSLSSSTSAKHKRNNNFPAAAAAPPSSSSAAATTNRRRRSDSPVPRDPDGSSVPSQQQQQQPFAAGGGAAATTAPDAIAFATNAIGLIRQAMFTFVDDVKNWQDDNEMLLRQNTTMTRNNNNSNNNQNSSVFKLGTPSAAPSPAAVAVVSATATPAAGEGAQNSAASSSASSPVFQQQQQQQHQHQQLSGNETLAVAALQAQVQQLQQQLEEQRRDAEQSELALNHLVARRDEQLTQLRGLHRFFCAAHRAKEVRLSRVLERREKIFDRVCERNARLVAERDEKIQKQSALFDWYALTVRRREERQQGETALQREAAYMLAVHAMLQAALLDASGEYNASLWGEARRQQQLQAARERDDERQLVVPVVVDDAAPGASPGAIVSPLSRADTVEGGVATPESSVQRDFMQSLEPPSDQQHQHQHQFYHHHHFNPLSPPPPYYFHHHHHHHHRAPHQNINNSATSLITTGGGGGGGSMMMMTSNLWDSELLFVEWQRMHSFSCQLLLELHDSLRQSLLQCHLVTVACHFTMFHASLADLASMGEATNVAAGSASSSSSAIISRLSNIMIPSTRVVAGVGAGGGASAGAAQNNDNNNENQQAANEEKDELHKLRASYAELLRANSQLRRDMKALEGVNSSLYAELQANNSDRALLRRQSAELEALLHDGETMLSHTRDRAAISLALVSQSAAAFLDAAECKHNWWLEHVEEVQLARLLEVERDMENVQREMSTPTVAELEQQQVLQHQLQELQQQEQHRHELASLGDVAPREHQAPLACAQRAFSKWKNLVLDARRAAAVESEETADIAWARLDTLTHKHGEAMAQLKAMEKTIRTMRRDARLYQSIDRAAAASAGGALFGDHDDDGDGAAGAGAGGGERSLVLMARSFRKWSTWCAAKLRQRVYEAAQLQSAEQAAEATDASMAAWVYELAASVTPQRERNSGGGGGAHVSVAGGGGAASSQQYYRGGGGGGPLDSPSLYI